MDHKDVALRVMQGIGGEQNIVAAAHCATRLRIVLKDSKLVDREALDNDPDLKGTFETGGMFQIIVGPGDVDRVFTELSGQTGRDIAVSTEQLKDVVASKSGIFTQAVKALADIFVPLIPILVGGGLLMAINNVLVARELFGPQSLIEQFPQISGAAEMINLLASAPFAFLPVLVGFTATKRFGGNEFLGAGMGMAMVFPSLVNGYDVATTMAAGEMPTWSLFGLDVAQAGYQGTVLPVLVVSFVLANIEKFFHRQLKGTADFLITPVLTLLITGFLTFIAIGPIMRLAGDWLANGLQSVYEFGGPIGGFLFGLVYSPIVITGLHQSFPPIELELFNQGGSFIFATASMANIAQGAACLAVFFLARNEKLKGLAGASGISAVLGITEPAIFGVNLRLRWPFFIGIATAAVGGALIAIFDIKAVALGAAGFLGVVSIDANDMGIFLICAVLTFAIAFATAWAYGMYLVRKNGSLDPDAVPLQVQSKPVIAPAIEEPSAPHSTIVSSPLTGEAVELGSVSDEMFAIGKLGPGVAIIPTEGKLVSPVTGKIVVAFPSGHAFAVRTTAEDGQVVDILMHIGFDTVNLKGKYFTAFKTQGEEVQAGETLCEFDIAAIEAEGYEVTTPVVVSNSRKTGSVSPLIFGEVSAGTDLLGIGIKETVA